MLERLFGRKKPPAADRSAAPSQTEAEALGAAADESPSPQAPAPAPASEPGSVAPELEKAMAGNVAMDSLDTRMRVYQELLFSDLLLAVPEGSEGEPDQGLRIAILKNAQNVQFAVAFTGEEAVRRWRPQGGEFVRIKGHDLFKLLDASPAEVIVINPASVPFIVLPKVEYRQLALGVVPQSQHSPVQNPSPEDVARAQKQSTDGPRPGGGAGPQQAKAAEGAEPGQIQVAFPPDVFSPEQASFIKTILLVHSQVEAAVFGALRPPGAGEDGWVRTIFLRTVGLEASQEAAARLTSEIKASIVQNSVFQGTGFEVGVMGDPQFWIAMHQNQLVAFDKKPPPLPPREATDGTTKPSGVVDALEDSDPKDTASP